jgi:predicted transcriptional regulator
MPQSLVEIANELTLALIQTWSIPPDNMQETLQQIYAILTTLKGQEETGPAAAMPAVVAAPAGWRTSITRHAVTCLECGHAFKQLSVRHLRGHRLDPRLYRLKYAIPTTQPLVARATTERRRQVVRATRPWEKAPTFIKGQTRISHPSPEPEAEALHEQTEAPTAAAPVQPKRQRKTTPKKTARKTRSEG